MSRSGVIVALALLAMCIVLVLVVLFKPVQEEVDVGASGMAAISHFYAADRLLNGLGLPAETAWGVDDPPEEEGVLLVLLDDNPGFRASVAEPLRAWVADGGRLLVAAPLGEEAPLLDAFGVERDMLVASEGTLSRLPLGAGPPVEAAHLPLWTVSSDMATTRWVVSGEDGVLLDAAIEVPYAQGWLGVVGGSAPWRTDHIGDAENATWLWEMARASEATSAVLVVRGGAPSLWSVLWQHGRTAIISLATLLLAAGWRAGWRFGPLLPSPSPQRRRIIEHIEATGALLWRQPGGREALLARARQAAGEEAPDQGDAVVASGAAFVEEVRRLQAAWRKP